MKTVPPQGDIRLNKAVHALQKEAYAAGVREALKMVLFREDDDLLLFAAALRTYLKDELTPPASLPGTKVIQTRKKSCRKAA